MKQKYVCCNSLKNLLTAILFFIALVFTSNAFAVECTDSVDNDNDGLIDANDLGCQGECGTTYYCGDSTTDRSMTDGNEKGREVKQGKESKTYGYNALADEYVDMIEAGILDPVKVTKSALLNAASVASMVLTTEAAIGRELPKDEKLDILKKML